MKRWPFVFTKFLVFSAFFFLSFNCQDGNSFKTVQIGSQVWMAENLKVTHYRNGDPILHATHGEEWDKLYEGAYCIYDNNPDNLAVYGRLYNWYAVTDPRNIAPEGWHVPTDEEWMQLEKYLGIDAGGKLKECRATHWELSNKGATNISGFSALPSGYRSNVSRFKEIGFRAYFWSSTDQDEDKYKYYAWYRYLDYSSSDVGRKFHSKQDGYSVRLIKDNAK